MAQRKRLGGQSAKSVTTVTHPSINTFSEAMEAAGPRPDLTSGREPKKAYAEHLSNKIAILIANKLRTTNQFKGDILPAHDGKGRETPVPSGAFNKPKKTDVNYSTLSGLELLVSIKTLNFSHFKMDNGQVRKGRYTKNMVRNDHELRAEAMEFHERYPFAVLVALFFIPRDACDDGAGDKSSFAHAVMTFRARTGRVRPDEPDQMFELFYIGLYEWEGGHTGHVEFFDVMDAPPKRGVPKKLCTLDQVVSRIVGIYGLRNQLYIPWEDEDKSQSSSPPELSLPPYEEAESASDPDENGA